MRMHAPSVVPGMLQAADYARALSDMAEGTDRNEAVDLYVDFRIARQHVIRPVRGGGREHERTDPLPGVRPARGGRPCGRPRLGRVPPGRQDGERPPGATPTRPRAAPDGP
ncbi:Scr1 family TA system antitoxin-like transcriptional regulator [Streptomyces sp. NPDC045470]|uniref:Scr1 family TA system antitoxin-like transcriptional regulator n=1 Tax=Streptomyces sp. NPDC045470 TaxID=3155469 RepID=UPI00340213CF